MPTPIVVYDACVLYPAPLRDLLMHLAMTGLIQAKWTEIIHEEWMSSVLENRPDITRKQLARVRALMNAHVNDCVVVDFEHLIPQLKLPDPDDRHVLAAAIHAKADGIVTFNLKDFPSAVLKGYGLAAIHPDAFVCDLLNTNPVDTCDAIRRQRASLHHPAKSVEEMLKVFAACQLSEAVEALQKHHDLL